MKKTHDARLNCRKCKDSILKLGEDFDAKVRQIESELLTKIGVINESITNITKNLEQLSGVVNENSSSKPSNVEDVLDKLIEVNGFAVYNKLDTRIEGSVDAVETIVSQQSCSSKQDDGSMPTKCDLLDKVQIACKKCNTSVNSRRQLVNHMVTVHGQERPFKCDRCPKQFSDRYSSHKHSETLHRDRNEKRQYICDVCPKILTTKSGLTVHKRVHTGEKPYVCDICRKQYPQRNSLIHHMRIHTKERPYMCHECSKTFGARNSFRLHMQSHLGIKPYKCTYSDCEWAFMQKSKLAIHIQSHTGERPVICPVCQKGYTKRYHVRKHIKNFHKIEDVDGVLDAKHPFKEATNASN